jgi:hypothetical protein
MPSALGPGPGSALALLAAIGAGQEQPPPHVLPRVEASRVVLDARVTDSRGRPLPGLGAADFRLDVDGRRTPVESAVWVAESPGAPRALPAPGAPPVAASPGRLVVLLFQKDFEPSRLRGLLQSIRQAKDLVAPFSPRDRVAVLTYDSRLRLHLDFTADFDAVRRVLDESVLLRWPAPITPGEPPSLAAHLDGEEARKAAAPEQALLALGRALRPIPGPKTVLFFSWGLGELIGGAVLPHYTYDEAAPPSTPRARPSSASM